MHIPDGFLSLPIAAFFYFVTGAVWFLSLRQMKRSFVPEQVPLFATLTAAVFAAQMINWPVGPGGTTAHFVGGALLAMFFGPGGGVLSMSLLLLIQCLAFGDGGITALGANIWNMGVVDGLIGYYLYIVFKRWGKEYVGAFLGGLLGITAAAFFCGLEIGLSPQFAYGINISIPVMTGIHFLLGIIEGIVTASVIAYVEKVRPDLLKLPKIKIG